jgi:putative Mg2+ transporter-C (MgtC) family protein
MGRMVVDGVNLAIPVQIVVATVLGGAIGLEREMSAQPAGLRTHMLVSLGSALFTLVGADTMHTDPTRIAAQVVTGVGFLGGGAILREGATVRGLTTAASLWMTAALGVAVGLQAWTAAVVTTIVGLVVLLIVRWFERDVLRRRRVLEVVLTVEVGTPLDRVVDQAASILPRSQLVRVAYDTTGQQIVMSSTSRDGASIAAIAERLRALGGVHGVTINR